MVAFGSSPLKDGLLRDELEWMHMLGVADCYSAVLRSGLDADAWCGGSFFKVLPFFFFKISTDLGFFMAIGSNGGLLTRSFPLALRVCICPTLRRLLQPVFRSQSFVSTLLIRVFPSANVI